MAVEYDCNLLHSIKLGGELTDIHSNVFSKYRRAKWCCEMIFDEYLSVFLDCYLVDEVHLGYWKPDFRVHDLLQFPCNVINCDHRASLKEVLYDSIYTFVSPPISPLG